VLHVPPQDLEKAVEADQAQRQYNSEMENEERNQEEDAYDIVGPFLTRPSDSEQGSNYHHRLSYRPLTSTSTVTTNNTTDRKRHTTSESDSSKPEKNTVEIAAFADADLYAQMKIRYPKDTMHKIKDYILTMINAVSSACI